MPGTATIAVRRELMPGGIKRLPPAYFSMVMATGIVALASFFELDARWLAQGLTYLNAAIFVVLFAMLITRAIRYRREFARDFKDFDRGPGFFTVVAATTILGG